MDRLEKFQKPLTLTLSPEGRGNLVDPPPEGRGNTRGESSSPEGRENLVNPSPKGRGNLCNISPEGRGNTTSPSPPKGERAGVRGRGKIPRIKSRKSFGFLGIIWCLVFWSLTVVGFCDILRLKETREGSEGNEVEVLEEKEDSFIIKVPKDEIEVLKRKRPTEMKLWHEKRILWEDTGDYLTIYLPKEKIVLPEEYKGEEYDAAKALEKELPSAGDEGRPPEATFWKGTGKLMGRVLKEGTPLSGAKIRIVGVPSGASMLSQIFGPRQEDKKDLTFEAVTDELGCYELVNIPMGEYDIFWSPPGSESWYRRLSEKPNITVRPAETVNYPDIELR